jgi:hypothetical protein
MRTGCYPSNSMGYISRCKPGSSSDADWSKDVSRRFPSPGSAPSAVLTSVTFGVLAKFASSRANGPHCGSMNTNGRVPTSGWPRNRRHRSRPRESARAQPPAITCCTTQYPVVVQAPCHGDAEYLSPRTLCLPRLCARGHDRLPCLAHAGEASRERESVCTCAAAGQVSGLVDWPATAA